MIVRAPGKLVLSGAYSVLEGAPAIVAAVNRYAIVDSRRRAEFVTPEVRAALGDAAPWFSADDLRDGRHKLGLGSSAAILVASLAAHEVSGLVGVDWATMRAGMFPRALAAHRVAQGGGSGLDVAASCFGGIIEYRLEDAGPSVRAVSLPGALVVEAWDSGEPASTARLVALVNGLKKRDPATFRMRMGDQADAAERAALALRSGDLEAWIASLREQQAALRALGREAGAPIITDDVAELARLATLEGAAVLPSGAGGGDVVLFQASSPSTPGFRRQASERGFRLLDLELGAEGVSAELG